MNLYQAAQHPQNRFRSLPNADPQTRDQTSYNAYPALFGQTTEGFRQVEAWGAQYRNLWAVEPVTGTLVVSGTAPITLTWSYAANVLPGMGYALLWNGSDVSAKFTPSWTVTVDNTVYTIPLTDIGTINISAKNGARVAMNAPIGGDGQTIGDCVWTVTPSSAPSATATVWTGLLFW